MAEWYTKIAEQVVGPLSAEQLRALADAGRLAPADPVSRSKKGPWVAASRVKGLFEVAAIDDEPEAASALRDSRTEQAPPASANVQKPADLAAGEPPIARPPVLMPTKTAAPASDGRTSVGPSPQAVLPTEQAPAHAGFVIQTEQAAATERFQKKKRVKKAREPLTKKQKNVRNVKWLAIAIVLAVAALCCVPFLRKLARTAPKSVTADNPVAADVDLVHSEDGLAAAFGAGSPSRTSRPAGTGNSTDRQAEVAQRGAAAPISDAVQVKAVRYVLDRPRMSGADGSVASPANRFLLVELALTTKRPDAPAKFRGWINCSEEISLTDDRGVAYKVRTPQNFGGMYVDGQCRETTSLSAEQPTTDVIVFAWPEDEAPELPSSSEEELKLRLPKSAYGEPGELRIAIPLSGIEVTEKAMAGPRVKAGGTSDDVQVDDGGPIPIPFLTD